MRDSNPLIPASRWTSTPGQEIRVHHWANFAKIEELVELFWLLEVYRKNTNKTGTSKVGAISKAQKVQKTFF